MLLSLLCQFWLNFYANRLAFHLSVWQEFRHYFAIQTTESSARARAIQSIAPPMAHSACTSIGIAIYIFFSMVEKLNQFRVRFCIRKEVAWARAHFVHSHQLSTKSISYLEFLIERQWRQRKIYTHQTKSGSHSVCVCVCVQCGGVGRWVKAKIYNKSVCKTW